MLGAALRPAPVADREAPQTKVRVKVEDRTHPATRHLGESFEIADDIYQFKDFDREQGAAAAAPGPREPRPRQPEGEPPGRDLPRVLGEGPRQRAVFYTALGDWEETWKDPRYRTHLLDGIRWAMGVEGEK